MSDVIIRRGNTSDSVPANFLIYSTGKNFFNYLFPYKLERILKILELLYEKDKGIFSHIFSTVATLNGNVVGLELGFTSKDKCIHSLFTDIQIAKKHNPIQIIQMIIRKNLINKFFMNIDNDSYYISNLAVIPSVQYKGIGSILLKNALDYAKAGDFKSCSLDVSMINTNAIKFYKKFGFKIHKKISYLDIEKKYTLSGQYRMLKKI